jgi:hypothetical protein
MPFGDLLRAFEGVEDLPVDTKAIKDWIVDSGVQDEIEFVGVDIDTSVLRGFLRRFRYTPKPYADPIWAAHIYYGKGQAPDWINIVHCKEMVHLLDGASDACKKEDFDTLLKRLTLPLEMKVLLEDPTFARVDKFGDLYAAALLIPMAARAQLKPALEAGDITIWDIARLAVIPPKYALMVMSDDWERVYEVLLKS